MAVASGSPATWLPMSMRKNGVKGRAGGLRSYASFEASFDDYVDFLHDNGPLTNKA